MRITGSLALAAALALLAAAPAAAVPATSPAAIPSVLLAGHCLIANPHGQGPGAERVSPNGIFSLQVTGESVDLDENETFPDGFSAGTWDWWQFLYPTSGPLNDHDKSRFCMRTNGDLVLTTSKGKLIWASHTAGSGRHNELTVRDDGDLTITTPAGKLVWSSGTTRTIWIAGAGLASGQHLVDRYREQFNIAPTWLIMRRDGALVLERAGRVLWTSGTHVSGAHAELLASGDLVIDAPSGRVLWRSRTRAHDAFVELNCGYVAMSSGGHRQPHWHEPPGPQPVC